MFNRSIIFLKFYSTGIIQDTSLENGYLHPSSLKIHITVNIRTFNINCRRQSISCCSRSSVEQSSAAPSLSIFCCRLKSHLFWLSYPAFWLFSHLYSDLSCWTLIVITFILRHINQTMQLIWSF